MADDITLSLAVGSGSVVATDDVGGRHFQAVKLDVGADGVSAPVSNSNPVPVSDAGGTLTVDNAGLTELAAAINGSSQVDVNIAASAATVAVSNAGLTELAAAINASSQVDVNLAASAATVPVSNSGLTELAAAINASSQIDVNVAAGGVAGRAEDAAHSSGHEGIVMLAVRRDTAAVGSDTDGDYSTVNVDSTGRVHVNVGNTVTVGSHAVTNAGTFAVQNTAQASTATQEIVGDAADDAAAAGNPVLVAGVAVETDGTDPTQVSAEGDAAQLRTDRQRILLVNETHPRRFWVSADYGAAQTNTSVQAAPGASLSLYITDIIISNGAVAGNITLLDGSGGTVVFEFYPAINGGVSAPGLRNPIRLTANTALVITSTTVTTHSVNIGGYTAP